MPVALYLWISIDRFLKSGGRRPIEEARTRLSPSLLIIYRLAGILETVLAPELYESLAGWEVSVALCTR